MRDEFLPLAGSPYANRPLPLTWVHTLVVGSGAAGLNAAVELRANGVEDVLIVTEGLDKGTSINTGSDKQTYYKLSLCGAEADSPRALAETYFAGGSMHGDLAMVEASLSARAFLHLVNLGVPFPRDEYGQFVGYKTDHDPRQRATSIGPYTSREMCRALIGQVQRLGIPVREGRQVVELVTGATNPSPPTPLPRGERGEDKGLPQGERRGASAWSDQGDRRVVGAIAVNAQGELEAYAAENVVFAVGGPGGLYKTSVYPLVHTGAVGLALLAGAKAQNLPESQYGMASVKFRWNVSGTYMQVIPRFTSTAADCRSDEREFLCEYFASPGELGSNVFLKGYQWPFDSRKVPSGSSIIDILVYVETVVRGRRVFLDFRHNPSGFSFDTLSEEARTYLARSGALLATPIERLRRMNPGAIELYADHGMDITAQPLEIAVSAQHNNGGLAANLWWESVNVAHLFPVGEVNGSHGVYRPGGSALNAGQVGGFRAAEYIANRYCHWTLPEETARSALARSAAEIASWISRCQSARTPWQDERDELQRRMSRAGAHIRSQEELHAAVADAWEQYDRIETCGCVYHGVGDLPQAINNRQLALAHAVYLDAVRFAVHSGVGSRGSAVVLDTRGASVHEKLGEAWRILPEDAGFRDKVLETLVLGPGKIEHRWVDRRPLPETDTWFETAWARFRQGEIYELPHSP